MNARTRFILGGIGGLAPIILFLVNLDFERYVADATTWKTVGYVVRAMLLFLLGGFVAYLHETENKRITLFLVGVSAPSLIAGYLSTASPDLSKANIPAVSTVQHLQHFFVPNAYADDSTAARLAQSMRLAQIKQFTLPPQNAGAQFLEGLFGTTPKNVWFVIVGSHPNANDAKNQAYTINQRYRNYHAEVYAPYGENPYYAVVIGAHLMQSEAKALRDKAVRDGLPQDSYYKTFPHLPPPA